MTDCPSVYPCVSPPNILEPITSKTRHKHPVTTGHPTFVLYNLSYESKWRSRKLMQWDGNFSRRIFKILC